jgi:hypothetical protein
MGREETRLLMSREESGELRPLFGEPEGSSFDDLARRLADATITRGRAIKLAGAVLAGSVLSVFFAPEADARRERRGRKFCKGPLGTSRCPKSVPGALASQGICGAGG